MTAIRRMSIAAAGLLAGLVGTLLMVLVMAASRTWLGISPPPEALPDRFAPTLDIATFFSLFGRFGGYNGLKQFGITSGLAGLFAIGILVGIAYALVVESRSSRAGEWWRGYSRHGLGFVVAAALVLWVALLVVLWPVLDANYRGLPPGSARVASAVGLLVAFAAYGAALVLTYRFITRRDPATDTTARVATTAPIAGAAAATGAAPSAAPGHGAALGFVAAAGEPLVPPAAAEPAVESPAASGPAVAAPAADTEPNVPVATPVGRRAVVAAAAGAAFALPSFTLVRGLYDRSTFPYDGLAYSGPGVQPIAPNDKFYTVTKNVVDPDVAPAVWRLDVGGLVDSPRQYTFDDIQQLPSIEQESTLMCISNRIGAGLFSNAVWQGVPMRDLLGASGVRDGAVEVLLRAADGYTDTFAIEKAMDPTTLVAYRMNGEPLPGRHGFPVRIVVPNLYGEKNVKWITAIEVVDHDAKGFYEQQGWGPNFVIPTRSDIFAPKVDAARGGFRFRDPLPANRAHEIRGRAFAGDRGVARVEFSADDGATWQDARIDYAGTPLTWVFWSARWRPDAPGEYRLLSRATDGTGAVQPPDERGIVPEGATGYHRVTATVAA